MTDAALNQALEAIYASLKNENEDIDARILALKIILHARKEKSVEVDPAKLAQPNRQGRKMMQSYFKKRGVTVTFADSSVTDEA
jgi:polyribonucleotide nucleotidyltransferase